MRVTFNMMAGKVRDDLMISSQRLMEAQGKASSGKKIHKPSDDISGAVLAMNLRETLSSFEQYERNANMARTELSITSHYVDSISNILSKIHNLALTATGPAVTGEAKSAILLELDQYEDSLVAAANAQYSGKYIFAGTKSNVPPMVANDDPDPEDPNPPPYIYEGDVKNYSITVSPGIDIISNVTADKLFNMESVSVPGSPDIFDTIKQLRAEIQSGDLEAISARLADIDANVKNVTSINVQVGARIQRLETMVDTILDSKLVFRELLSQTEDIDLTEAVMELSIRENVYQAAIAIAGRVMQISLADYIK